MFDGKFRAPVERAVKPIGDGLRKTRLTPDHLTLVGLVVGAGAGVAIGWGALNLGLLLVIMAALPDLLDGALAKASGASSQRGAFFDSVIDRVTDAFLFCGVAWFIIKDNPDHPHLGMLPVAVMAVSSLISYERAKAESLGLSAKGGLMERAERVILLCFGLLFDNLLVAVMWVMLVLVTVTAVQRFFKVWKQAAVAPVTAARIEMRRSRRQSRRFARADRRSQVRVKRARPRPGP
jgi:CDP-diacylglycerol---glycerol-3-phosphate 3-phosphatidyltransferase